MPETPEADLPPLPPDDFDGSTPTAADSLPPLSVFFPTITEAEAEFLDGGTLAIMERRTKVMERYRRGMTMHAIAEEVKCGHSTVHRDIHAVLEGYKRIALRSAAEHTADMLQRLAHREAQVEIDLERSRGEQIETLTGKRTNKGGDVGQASVKKRTKYGDPRLHALLYNWHVQRCKLLGLLRPEDFKKDDLPAVKLVAGIDPAELV